MRSSPFLRPLSRITGYTTQSVTHGQCDARPTVTFPVAEHYNCFWPVLISHPAEGRRLSWPE